MNRNPQQVALSLVNDLFVNGNGERADRLLLVDKNSRDLGGLCESAVRDRILDALADADRSIPHASYLALKGLEQMKNQLEAQLKSVLAAVRQITCEPESSMGGHSDDFVYSGRVSVEEMLRKLKIRVEPAGTE